MKNWKQCRLDVVQIVDVAVQQAVAQMRCPKTLLSPRAGELCDNGSEIPLTLLPGARRGLCCFEPSRPFSSACIGKEGERYLRTIVAEFTCTG